MTRRLVNIMDMPDPEAALLPCPFCGGEAHSVGYGPYHVICKACGARTTTAYTMPEKGAVELWNRRHPPASREEGLRVKALEWCDPFMDVELRGGLYTQADSMLGMYKVWGDGSWSLGMRFVVGHGDLDDGKSAAQEHYTNAVRSAIETLIPTKPEAKEAREVSDEMEVLRRLADGDALAYSRDGDNCWFTSGDRAWVAAATVIAMREKGYLRRSWAADDPWGTDGISDAGRAALQSKKPE